MRIRKRAVPLPLSLLSPVRLLQLSDDSPPPADDLLIGRDRTAAFELKGYGNGKNKEKKEGNNHTSKESDTGAVSDNGGGVSAAPPPTPSNNQSATEGRWCEGDKAIPFKKRKVSLELEMCKIGSSTTMKMKSKTNKKCRLLDDDNSSDSDYDEKSKKKRKKGKTRKTKYSWRKEGSGMLMEGSRCSRVNGRGWRCLQPTLVGYSLCEHHLGKGRLRSISGGVRVEKLSTAPASSTPPRASEVKMINCSDEEEEEEEGSEKKKKKKRRKVGMVKARSLSSLLCQPETKVVVHHAPASNVVS